jgi:hypothetical protein
MAIKKLILNDFIEETNFSLIGIHCSLEDYRLAYLLNSHLNINLRRKSSDLDYNNGQVLYSIFEWENTNQLTTWNLVSNSCKLETFEAYTQDSLFPDKEKLSRIHYLVPEYKTVNYLLKIDSELEAVNSVKSVLLKIQKITQIITAYNIHVPKLKSKDNLIFN